MPERPFEKNTAGDQQNEEQSINKLDEDLPANNNEQFGIEEEDDENQSTGDEEVCFFIK